MARRRYYRKRDSLENIFEDILRFVLIIVLLGFFAWGTTHKEELKQYSIIAIIAASFLVVGVIALTVLWKKRKFKLSQNSMDDEKILFMLKGMDPTRFESEIADMFQRLGFKAERTGGANDGGIDVVAYKDGKKYYVQCKKFMTREVTPHDVRDFLGAITNVNNPAEKGYFVTTNKFTLMAEKAAEGNPRIELIDGIKLIEYYRQAHGKEISLQETPDSSPIQAITKTCPKCGGTLQIRIAGQGDYAGKKFWGCSNFPKCRYTENI